MPKADCRGLSADEVRRVNTQSIRVALAADGSAGVDPDSFEPPDAVYEEPASDAAGAGGGGYDESDDEEALQQQLAMLLEKQATIEANLNASLASQQRKQTQQQLQRRASRGTMSVEKFGSESNEWEKQAED